MKRNSLLPVLFVGFTWIAIGCFADSSEFRSDTNVGNLQEDSLLQKVVKSESEWRSFLSDEQFYVMRKKGTERAFTSPLNSNKAKGIYYCAACHLSLFDSKTKFNSGTGWPSFYAPIFDNHIQLAIDNSLFESRNEVLCARCDGHLGHVFDDGPPPTGKRYCINGVALAFEPK